MTFPPPLLKILQRSLFTTHAFDKDVKRCKKRGYPMEELAIVIDELIKEGKVDANYHPHMLSGNRQGQ